MASLYDQRRMTSVAQRDLTGLVRNFAFPICGEQRTRYADLYIAKHFENPVFVKAVRRLTDRDCEQNEPLLVGGLRQEVCIWQQLSHPNIVPFLGVLYIGSYPMSLVTPYYEGGNVIEYLANNPEADFMHLVLGIVEALWYLHANSVTHMNLHGSNVVVDENGNALLTDVGLAPVLGMYAFSAANIAGTGRWEAPEVIRWHRYDTVSPFTPASDVYSLSMLLIEMVTLQPPFSDRRSGPQVWRDVLSGCRPCKPWNMGIIGERLWPLIETCWHQNPTKRPNVLTILHELKALDANIRSVIYPQMFIDYY